MYLTHDPKSCASASFAISPKLRLSKGGDNAVEIVNYFQNIGERKDCLARNQIVHSTDTCTILFFIRSLLALLIRLELMTL